MKDQETFEPTLLFSFVFGILVFGLMTATVIVGSFFNNL